MSDVTSLFNSAELALAAYADLFSDRSTDDPSNIQPLTGTGPSTAQMTLTQAGRFAARYSTIVTQTSDDPSGFSATVFKDASGNLTLAIRGTEPGDVNDLEADAYILGAGAAYNQIVAMVNWWKQVSSPAGTSVPQYRLATYDPVLVPEGAVVLQNSPSGVLVLEATDSILATGELSAALAQDADGKIDVTGHSLGGHLAMAFSTLFANQVGETIAFNAPGFLDSETNQDFFGEMGGVVPTDTSVTNVTNVIADEALVGEQPFSPIAGLWSEPGQDVRIAIERQWLSDEPDASSPWNHSMFVLADSLAVYKLLQDLAPALDEAKYKQILNQAAQGTAAGYERIVDALEVFLGIDQTLLASGNLKRELLYQAIYRIKDNLTYQTWAGQLEIRPTVDNAAQLLLKAQDVVEGLAHRYAITALNPFVMLAPGLYAGYEPGGAKAGLLDLYDRDTNPSGITQIYLDQRAQFLERKLYITGLDLESDYQPRQFPNIPDQRGQDYQAQNRHYEDRASGFIASTGGNPNPLHHYLFGREGSDELKGAGVSDYLYGGAGTDYLEGKFADDYLEGGRGMDLYAYSAPANDGNDTILDIDGKGVLRFTGPGGVHSVIAEASVQNSPTQWSSADGRFTYTKETNASGGTDLLITMAGVSGGSIRLQHFRDGDFGIRLWEARANPGTTRNVTGTEQGDQLYGDRLPPAGGDRIEGLGGNDVILADRPGGAPDDGTGDNDWVIAGDGRDDVDAGAGNDLVEAGGDGELGGDVGGDLVYGGAGDDELYAESKVALNIAIAQGNTATSLTQKGDVLSGGAGDDWIVGGAARDALLGGGGSDLIVGGAGDDDIWGDVGDVAAVFAWSVTRDDGSTGGNVEAVRNGFVSADTSAGGADVIYAGRGIDWVFAGAGDDFIDGGADSDVLFGEAGSDIILGGGGDDYLIGDNPGVVGSAEEGDDYLEGGDGTDYLQGDGGADILVGGRGNDTLAGGPGKDVYVFKAGDGLDTIIDVVTGPEASVIVHERGYDPNTLRILPGSMIIDLGGGDAIEFASFDHNDPNAPAAFETFSFGDGTRLSFADVLAIGFTIDGTSGDDDGVANPIVVGTAFRDIIRAFGGNDEAQGRQGDDDIDGGPGNDRLYGGGGNDVLIGGSGHDVLSGEAGDDSLYGDFGNDWLWGGAGNDYLDGGGGFDQLFGGAGDDSYKFNIGSNVLDTEGAVRVVFADIGVIYEVAPSEISLTRQVVNGAPVYAIGYTGPAVAGTQEMFVRLSADAQLAEFEFADGTVLDHESLLRELWVDQAFIVGTPGDDIIDGYAGDDFLQGGEGNDSLSGHKGEDRLEGGDGNDTLLGGAGDDLLIAGAGADVLDGGAGDDQLDGGSGDDTYLIGASAGRDSISEGGAGDFDTVIFEGLRADATLLRLPSGDLSVVFVDGSTLTAAGQYTNPALKVERLVFGDNATVEIAELDALTVAPITGTSGDDNLLGTQYGDTLLGLEGNDFLDGGAGDDRLEGGAGADTYRLRLAGGVDRAVDDGVEASIIQLDPGIGFAHLAVAEAGNDLVVSVPGTDSGMVLTDYYLGQTNWTVRMQSGEQKTVPELIGYLAQIEAPATVADWRNRYVELAKVKYLAYLTSFGYTGGVVFHDRGLSNAPVIRPFETFYETRSTSNQTSFMNIGMFSAGGSDNVMDFRSTGLVIADAGAGNDLINNLGWGVALNTPDTWGSFLHGGAGDDAILGSWSADIIIGGAGSDFMDGSQGDDVFIVFQTDAGVDIIDEVSGDWSRQPNHFADTNSGRFSTDSLVFVGVASTDATLSIGLFDTSTVNFEGFGRVYATLDINYGIGLVRVVLPDPGELDVYYNNGDLAGIETIRFSDGVTLTLDGISETFEIPPLGAPGDERTRNGSSGNDHLLPFARDRRTSIFGFGGDDYSEGGFTDDYLDGGDGKDVIHGLAGNDVIAGGPGDDMLVGGAGSDTYIFNVGDGIDTVFDPLGSNTVRFGAGVVSEDLSLDVGSLLLRIGGTGDAIHFESFDAQNPFGLRDADRFVFSDASELSYADLLARGFDISGTSGGDVLSGTAIVDRIRGGVGDDVLAGGLGSDTYYYDTGDGSDTIQEGADPSSTDVLRFGTGIASTDLAVSRELDDIVIDLPAAGDQVRLSGWFTVPGGTVEHVDFADGSFWTAAELESRTTATNQPPVLANPIADQQATEDTAFSFTVAADAFADPDPGDTLTFTTSLADGSPLPAWLVFDGPTRMFSGTPVDGSSGLLTIRVTATDTGSESVFDDFVLDIANLISGTPSEDVLTGTALRDVILGFEGNDQISAGDGDDTIDAGAGFAFITGGAGSDTVIFARGSHQTLSDNESSVGNPDVLRFAADILPSDVKASRYGTSLTFTVIGTTDFVTLNKYFLLDTVDPSAARIEFASDGTVWDFEDIRPMVLIGSDSADSISGFTTDDYMDGQGGNDGLDGRSGNDTLIGGTGADSLYGGDGDDILDGRPGVFSYSGDRLRGGAGNDTYRYGYGGGYSRIGEQPNYDPASGFDTILVDADLLPSEVRLQRDTETTLRLFLPDFSSSMWIDGQFNRSGSGFSTIEEIRFAADGTTWDMATINQMVATPTSGNDLLWGSDPVADFLQGFDGADRLYGFDGDDVLDGGTGDDLLDGREGSDTYIFDTGYGADQISEYAGQDVVYGGPDVVQFGAGIAPSSVTVARVGDDLVMTLDGTSDKITMGIWFSSGFSTADVFIEEFRFANGTVWTDETIGALFPITGTAGADTLQGTLRATTLYGLGGNDTIYGNWRNDTLDGGAGADTLAGGPGNDTYIIDSTGDQAYESPNYGIDTVLSSVSWTLGANFENLTLTGSSNLSGTGNALDNTIIGNSGRNTLTGGAGNDWLDGGANRDTLVGGTGDDTYVVDHGSDSITENANAGIDTVRSTLAWTLGSNLENLTLLGTANINGTGNTLANVLTGNAGNNTLTGNAGNDTLDGQAGADTLIGGTGNDTYLLGRGHGAELVQENDTTAGNTDIGQFLESIAPEQIWFRQSGSNLEVSVIGTPDKLTIQNWYSGGQYRLEQFRTEDGQMLMEAQVQNLVDAMAAFSPPPPGQETLPPNYATALNPVIAANWQ